MGRKVLLVMGAKGPESFQHARVLRLLVIGFISLCLHYFTQPFDDREFKILDRIESMGLIAFVSLPLARLVLDLEIPDKNEGWSGPLILSSVFLVNLFYLFMVAWAYSYRRISNTLVERRKKLEAAGKDPKPTGALAAVAWFMHEGQIEVTKEGTINMSQLSEDEKDHVLSVLANAITEVAQDLDYFCYDVFPLFLQCVAARLVRMRLAEDKKEAEKAEKALEDQATDASIVTRLRNSVQKMQSSSTMASADTVDLSPKELVPEARAAVRYLRQQAEVGELPSCPIHEFYDYFMSIVEEVKVGAILLPEPRALLASGSAVDTTGEDVATDDEDAWSWTDSKQQDEVALVKGDAAGPAAFGASTECVDVGTQAVHVKVQSRDASTQSPSPSLDVQVQAEDERLPIPLDEGRGDHQEPVKNPPVLQAAGHVKPSVSARLGQGFDSIAAFFAPEVSTPRTPHENTDSKAGAFDGTNDFASTIVPAATSARAESQWPQQLVQDLFQEPQEEQPQQPAAQVVSPIAGIRAVTTSSSARMMPGRTAAPLQEGTATPQSSSATLQVNAVSRLAKLGIYEEMPSPMYQENPLGKHAPGGPPPSPRPNHATQCHHAPLDPASANWTVHGPWKPEGPREQIPRPSQAPQTPMSSENSSMMTGVTRPPGAPVKPLLVQSPRLSDLSLMQPGNSDLHDMVACAWDRKPASSPPPPTPQPIPDILASSQETAPSKKGTTSTTAEPVPAAPRGVGARNRLEATAESEDMGTFPASFRSGGNMLAEGRLSLDAATTSAQKRALGATESGYRFDWFQR